MRAQGKTQGPREIPLGYLGFEGLTISPYAGTPPNGGGPKAERP